MRMETSRQKKTTSNNQENCGWLVKISRFFGNGAIRIYGHFVDFQSFLIKTQRNSTNGETKSF